jgi:hypothetical protein
MVNGEFGVGEKVGKGKFKQEDERAAIDTRAIGSIHGDGNAMRLDFNWICEFVNFVIDDRGDDGRAEVIFHMTKKLAYGCAARRRKHPPIWEMKFNVFTGFNKFYGHDSFFVKGRKLKVKLTCGF